MLRKYAYFMTRMLVASLLSLAMISFFQSCKKPPTDPPIDDVVYFPPNGSSTWATSSPASLGWNTAFLPELTNLLEQSGTRAFLVLVDGKIVLEYYYGTNALGTAPFGASTNWYWASAGKTLTAWMTGKAQEEGFLFINKPTSDYLGKGWTSLTPTQEDKITVWHQLTMTTGLDDAFGSIDDTSAAALKYKAEPGTRWSYHNAPYTLLERVIANASGKKFTDYFNEKLRNPIGMDGFWLWTGNNHVYYSTARSMARFGWLVLNNGNWSGQQLLAASGYINSMRNTSQALNKSYGYLWWLNGKESYMLPSTQLVFNGSFMPDAPADMYSALGKNGQILQVIPSKRMVVVRMGENPDQGPVSAEIGNDIWKILKKIVE
jgi:CubicO group peptidase (beta-lactamase class C family)